MNTKRIEAYKCEKCGMAYLDEQYANKCCTPKACKDCGKEILSRSRYSLCTECLNKLRLQQEKNRYNKAIKYSYEQCPDDHKIMMYSDSYGYNEGYFTDIEELVDYCEEEDVPIPEYCWSTTEIEMSIDADNLIENACEDMYEDAEYHIDDGSRKELQDYLDKWCKEQNIRSYVVDYKYAIKITYNTDVEK